jgi:lipopolysaccharide export system permease protein
MRILTRYVLYTFLKNYLISLMVLIGLYIVLHMVFSFDELAENVPAGTGGFAAVTSMISAVGSYYLYHSFLFFVQLAGIIPVVAAAFTLIRLSRFNELSAILAAGVPLIRVALPIIISAMFLYVFVILNQELVIPRMIPQLTKKPDELNEKVSAKSFQIKAMQGDNNALLVAGRYTPPTNDEPAKMDVVDIIERDEKRQPTAHIYADSAEWDEAKHEWKLTNGKIIQHLLPDEKPSPPMNVAAYRSTISPDEIALYKSSEFVDLLSTQRINQMLQRPKSYGTIALLITKHFRMAQFFVNITLLLLAIPCVLTRDPGGLKGGALKCLILTGACLGTVFLARHIASMPPAGSKWLDMWPAIWACVPLFIFLPLAIYLLDRRAQMS